MFSVSKKWIISAAIVLVALIALAIFVFRAGPEGVVVPVTTEPAVKVIGKSVQGRPIEAYTFGSGPRHIVFVGAIHGGYEWMTTLLSYRFIDYLIAHPTTIPVGLRVTVIPEANPDGLFKVVGKTGRFLVSDVPIDIELTKPGRFNANNVDLNRNFDCLWQATSTWQSRPVSGGTNVFSEPEAQALRDYFLAPENRPTAVIFWHSQADAVYAAGCNGVVIPGTIELLNTYASASGYRSFKTFDSYVVTGAAEDWLSKIGIPAITVELKSHRDMEWEKNLLGARAIIESYGK